METIKVKVKAQPEELYILRRAIISDDNKFVDLWLEGPSLKVGDILSPMRNKKYKLLVEEVGERFIKVQPIGFEIITPYFEAIGDYFVKMN